MAVEPAPTQTGNGLKNIIDLIIAPTEALQSLDAAPTWGWAFLITVVLVALGSFLMTPAMTHAFTTSWPSMVAKDPRLAAQSAEQTAAGLAIAVKFVQFTWIFVAIFVPFYFLMSAIIMSIFNAVGRGSGTFGKYWAVSCNIGVIAGGLGSVVLGVITTVRGADSFMTMPSVQGAMPSLGWLAPGSGLHLLAFLTAFTPFTIWATWLTVQTMLIVGRVPKLQAWLTGAIAILVPALLAGAFAK